MSKRAEEKALEAYPKEEGKMYSTAFGTFEFDRNAAERKGFQEGYELAEKESAEAIKTAEDHAYFAGSESMREKVISLIESRISEILGDAQPAPVLRTELQELIKRIKKEEK